MELDAGSNNEDGPVFVACRKPSYSWSKKRCVRARHSASAPSFVRTGVPALSDPGVLELESKHDAYRKRCETL